jgi:hypothetical protein
VQTREARDAGGWRVTLDGDPPIRALWVYALTNEPQIFPAIKHLKLALMAGESLTRKALETLCTALPSLISLEVCL